MNLYKITALALFLLMASGLMGQLNVELLSTVEYDDRGNDVWGYVAPDGSEYAIMGTLTGVSIVDVTIATSPVELLFIPQQESIWRDIKTHNNHAYVVADQNGTDDGILIIDFSNLPDITYENINPFIPGEEEIHHCHNLYIDDGYAYLAGCNGESGRINEGGVLVFDVASEEGEPVLVGKGAPEYSHDVYARDNVLYSSEIFRGTITLYDVTDKDSIVEINSQSTPFEFTHNAWLSDDGNTIFTTDEKRNAPVAAYDITDPQNIKFLDQFRPRATVNTGVIPHNVHVWDDYLIISYYTDGCIIVDASRPDNLIEVGNWDTYFDSDIGSGFGGNWGAYPFFPSRNIILGDISGAMHVVGPDYKRACHIEGIVTSRSTGMPIINARISSEQIDMDEWSKINGDYKTGTALAGTYEIKASAPGYVTETRTVVLENGKLNLEDFQLEDQKKITLSGVVVDSATGEQLEDAVIRVLVNGVVRQLTSDQFGAFVLNDEFAGEYDFVVGKWGYKTKFLNAEMFDGENATPQIELALDNGYEDGFSLDLGWERELDGERGNWERVVPIGIRHQLLGLLVTPETDSDKDQGSRAYVTGQSTDLEFGKLVGKATLTSPAFFVGDMENPVVQFDYWLWAISPTFSVTDDALKVSFTNGIDTILVESITMENLDVVTWKSNMVVPIKDHFELNSEMKVIIEINNEDADALVDAGIDFFRIVESMDVSAEDLAEPTISCFPNPTSDKFRLSAEESIAFNKGVLSIYSVQGQLISTYELSDGDLSLEFGEELGAGFYVVSLVLDGKLEFLKTLVKSK